MFPECLLHKLGEKLTAIRVCLRYICNGGRCLSCSIQSLALYLPNASPRVSPPQAAEEHPAAMDGTAAKDEAAELAPTAVAEGSVTTEVAVEGEDPAARE